MKRIFTLLCLFVLISHANAKEMFTVKLSALETKSIKVNSFVDPDFKNIVCYVSYIYEESLFQMAAPSNSGISCVTTASVDRNVLTEVTPYRLEEVYSKKLSVIDKMLRVNRFLDRRNNTIIYVAYSNKTGGGSEKHAITSVKFD